MSLSQKFLTAIGLLRKTITLDDAEAGDVWYSDFWQSIMVAGDSEGEYARGQQVVLTDQMDNFVVERSYTIGDGVTTDFPIANLGTYGHHISVFNLTTNMYDIVPMERLFGVVTLRFSTPPTLNQMRVSQLLHPVPS